jgi:3'(2'), 5'-bisphosphate nucleotidase
MNYHAYLDPLKNIARKAGASILEVYREEGDFGVETKSDKSPLTRADKAANQIICDFLGDMTPEIPIISEENKEVPYSERKNYTRFWLVDPLDGTKEFIKRNGEFTVNIALVSDRQPVLGVVFAPVLDELAWAIKGEGSWMEKGGRVERLRSLSFRYSDPGLRVVCSRSHLNPATQAFIDRLDRPEKVSRGSSLKFLIIAAGEAHVYPRLGPTMEWDTGAAQVILEEAGGRVEVADSRESLLYNKESLLNPEFIAMGQVANS